jgi:histidinol-phosphate phosphatase family protein
MKPVWMNDIGKQWTLFLDRDGVINREKEGDYIRQVSEFSFLEGVLQAFPLLAQVFGRIFIVTNQKGVGKGWMTMDDLDGIHSFMVSQVVNAGGRLDRIYHCTETDNEHPDRKPNTGMGLRARQEFPEVDFTRSLMIGNTLSDMRFGKALGMRTIFIPSAKPPLTQADPLVDAVFPDLLSVAKALPNPITSP